MRATGLQGPSLPYPIPLALRRRLVQRQIVPQDHAIVVPGRGPRDQLLAHVLAHRGRIALERIAKTAAAAGAHDDPGVDRHRNVAASHGLECVLARQADQVIAVLARLAAPEPPGAAFLPPGMLEVPLALDQVAHLHVDAEAAAEFAGAAGVRAQAPRLDQHRAFQFDALDRAVAHVALADRDGRRLA